MHTITSRILLTFQNFLAPLQPMVAPGPTVNIAAGTVIGTTLSLTDQPTVTAVANTNLGIPYVKSPPERLSPPEEHEPWQATRPAQKLLDACIQIHVAYLLFL
jgi:carboxylesterase 2